MASRNWSVERLSHLVRTRMRLGHFVLINAIATEGSIQKASAAQRLSQPAVSKALREIETVLGCQIFQRSRAGVHPTELGQVVVSAAAAILRDVDGFSAALVSAASGSGIRLRVGYIHSVSKGLLSESIGGSKAMERMTFDLRLGTSPDIVAGILDHGLDCGIVRFSGAVEGLSFEELYVQRGVVITARESAFADRDLLTSDRVRWILPPPGTPTRATIDRLFIAHRSAPPQPEIECFDASLIPFFLEQDPERAAILPEDVVADMPASRLRVGRALPDMALPPICFARRTVRENDPSINIFLASLQRSIAAGNLARHAGPVRAARAAFGPRVAASVGEL